MGRSNRNAWPCKTNRQRLGQTKERNFKREMARAGTVSIRGREYAKLQLRTVEQILSRCQKVRLHQVYDFSQKLSA